MESVNSRTAKIVTTLVTAAWLVGMPAAALAQSASGTPAKAVGGRGYGFGGLGAVTSGGESMGTWHVGGGGGGEAVIRDALGIGAVMLDTRSSPRDLPAPDRIPLGPSGPGSRLLAR